MSLFTHKEECAGCGDHFQNDKDCRNIIQYGKCCYCHSLDKRVAKVNRAKAIPLFHVMIKPVILPKVIFAVQTIKAMKESDNSDPFNPGNKCFECGKSPLTGQRTRYCSDECRDKSRKGTFG